MVGAALAAVLVVALIVVRHDDGGSGADATLTVSFGAGPAQPTGIVESGGEKWMVCERIPLAGNTVVHGHLVTKTPTSSGDTARFEGEGLKLTAVNINSVLPCGAP